MSTIEKITNKVKEITKPEKENYIFEAENMAQAIYRKPPEQHIKMISAIKTHLRKLHEIEAEKIVEV